MAEVCETRVGGYKSRRRRFMEPYFSRGGVFVSDLDFYCAIKRIYGVSGMRGKKLNYVCLNNVLEFVK